MVWIIGQKIKKKEKNKETKEATSEKRAATNDISEQQKEEEEEGNEKKQHKKGGSVADRVASIEKEQKQEEGRDGASTPPPPTTEIILSDDEDEEKMDEYNAHGVSHVFELEDVFTEAVSDLDWSLDGSVCSRVPRKVKKFACISSTITILGTRTTRRNIFARGLSKLSYKYQKIQRA